MLSYIIKNLKDQAPFTEIRNYVRERVMNWIDLNDLQYHAKVLKLLQQQQSELPQKLKTQQSNKTNSPNSLKQEKVSPHA